MENKIFETLEQFNTFSLKELDAAELIERKDFKYIFQLRHLPDILLFLKDNYKVLRINDNLFTDYVTDYYDTTDFKFYNQHHNGHLNRYKVRVRQYVQSALYFFEVKFKNNKNWTNKDRLRVTNMHPNINELLKIKTTEKVEYKLTVDYRRITLLSNNGFEKLTLDFRLSFDNKLDKVDFYALCIAEVKAKTHHPYLFRQYIKQLGYRTQGLSKYCFGISNLYKQLKSNNFKHSKLYIKKLTA